VESPEQDIVNRILKDATQEAEQIVKSAKMSAESLLEKQRQSGRDDAQKQANTILRRAQNEADIIRGKTSSDIRRQASWSVLSEKNRLIQKVIDEAKNRLFDIEKTPQYVQFLEKLTVDAGSVLGGGELMVLLNQKDSKLQSSFSKLAKKITEATGVKTNLSRSEQDLATSGILIKKVESKIFVDNTIEAIFKRQEKQLKLKIAKILFATVN
jgi:V/A-type H+-transporting ATPase subunit E